MKFLIVFTFMFLLVSAMVYSYYTFFVLETDTKIYKHIYFGEFDNRDSEGVVAHLTVGDLNGDGEVDYLFNAGMQ